MIVMRFPKMNEWVVVQQRTTLNALNNIHQAGRISLRPKNKRHPWRHIKSVDWVLEPGEWYEIGNVWYPKMVEAPAYLHAPMISLKLNRSKKGRQWVKKKMQDLAKLHLDTSEFNCTDRTVNCSAIDLNGKMVLAPDMATALLYSKQIKGDLKCSNKNDRWNLIAQGVK